MADRLEVKELDQVVVRFSGDSGDGMQLAGNIFSTVSATVEMTFVRFPIIRLISGLRRGRRQEFPVLRYTLVNSACTHRR